MSYYTVNYNFKPKTWDIPGHYVHIGMGVLLFSLVLYIFTLAPTVIWGDSAAFALQVKKLQLSYGITGHPLFIILGKLFSFLPFELAYSLNLLTAVTASVAVFLVYLIIFEITNSKVSSLVGSIALCASHAFWLHAVIAEVYDLNAAFVAAVILFLLKWRKDKNNYTPLYLASFLFGLGLSNHRIMVFDIIGVVIFVLITESIIFRKLKVMLSLLLSFFAGSSLLLYLLLKNLMTEPILSVADTFTAEGYKGVLSIKYKSPQIFEEIGLYLSYLFYQFPFIGFLLGFAGIVTLFRKDKKLTLLFVLLIGINALFFLRFGPAFGTTKYTFYISAYMVFSILIGYGFYSLQTFTSLRLINDDENNHYDVIARRPDLEPKAKGMEQPKQSGKKFSLLTVLSVFLLPILFYNVTPYASKSLNVDLLHARTIPYRDNEEFFLDPVKRNYYGAAKYASEVFVTARPDSIIIADHTPFTVLRYFQEIKGLRKDVMIIMSTGKIKMKDGVVKPIRIKDVVAQYYGNKDIYLADMENESYYRLKPLKNDYDFIPDGVLYRVVRKGISRASEG